MLAPTPDTETRDLRIIIRPNRSLSPRGMVLFVAAFAVVSLGIGAGFALAGAWLVLPFAGLEVAIVAAAFEVMRRHAGDYELIAVQGDEVIVQRRSGSATVSHRFQRYWARVVYEGAARPWESPRVRIGSHGRSVEIGTLSTDAGRESLAHSLGEALQTPARV